MCLPLRRLCGGKKFVSGSSQGYEFTDTSVEKTAHRHAAPFMFDADDTSLLDSLTRFIRCLPSRLVTRTIVVLPSRTGEGLVSR